MIDTIVFDVGNVLVDWNYTDYLERLGFSCAAKEAVTTAVFQSPVWNSLDKGTISPEDAIGEFISRAPRYGHEIRQAFAGCEDCIHPFPYSADWIKSLKEQGLRILILSNYSEYLFDKTKDKMKFLSLVDGTLFSFRCKMVKPQPEIYRLLIDMFGLVPENTVFIDDRPDNTDAAAAFGIHAIRFKGYSDAVLELKKLGISG